RSWLGPRHATLRIDRGVDRQAVATMHRGNGFVAARLDPGRSYYPEPGSQEVSIGRMTASSSARANRLPRSLARFALLSLVLAAGLTVVGPVSHPAPVSAG